MIVPPYWWRHSHMRSRNSSRPSSSLLVPWALSARSTWVWVAMPAWSVPRIHLVLRPCMRAWRISASWIEPLSAWPMWSAPVTLGGGIAIE